MCLFWVVDSLTFVGFQGFLVIFDDFVSFFTFYVFLIHIIHYYYVTNRHRNLRVLNMFSLTLKLINTSKYKPFCTHTRYKDAGGRCSYGLSSSLTTVNVVAVSLLSLLLPPHLCVHFSTFS